jgi:hypothetical protein
MNRICTHRIFFLFVSCLLLFVASPVRAAEFYFDAPSPLGVGDSFEAVLYLNTEEINAVEGTIVFPSDVLQLSEIREANSIINLWVEKPRLVSDGQIVFSGIIPGGYQGPRGSLLRLVFVAKKEGQGAIEVKEARALLNDGKGTETALTIFPYRYTISKAPGGLTVPVIQDEERPESFAPEVYHDHNLLDDQWFMVFATQDKRSGIDHYEVKEARHRISGMFKGWTTAESPYVLQDRELRSTIFVKAIDKAGNARIETIPPRNPLRWYEDYENWIIILLGSSLAFAFGIYLWRKHEKASEAH